MPRVLITPVYLQNSEGPHTKTLADAGFEVCYPTAGADVRDPEVLKRELADIDAVLASMEPYSADVLQASRLRVIARSGVGYDAVDVEAATREGVLVTITPGANKEGVAEHALAMMLALAHGFPQRDRDVRRGGWNRTPMPRLAGRVLGLVGLGAIGREVALRAAALGMTVLASDPVADPDFATAHSIEMLELEALLGRSDVVSLHLPCTAATSNLFDATLLAKMKCGALLINTARGGLIDEAALVEALQSGQLGGAALDVFQDEPPSGDHPLLSLDNVLLCPHMGGLDQQSLAAMAALAAESIVDLFRGNWPDGRVVNATARGDWVW